MDSRNCLYRMERYVTLLNYSNYKAREGWCGDWLFPLTEGSKNQWVAYDPEADKWHSLLGISQL